MDLLAISCPRCFVACRNRGRVRFCPRCGLAQPSERAADRAPLCLTLGRQGFEIGQRIAIGSISTLYRCRSLIPRRRRVGLLKITRDACTNELIANEAVILRSLQNSGDADRFRAFIPALKGSFTIDDSDGSSRQANVLELHEEIRSPNELYALSEVRRYRPEGLDGRDMAWIWRRLLYVLGYIHGRGVVHGAVLPMHVLIEPREHKLLLIDWCGASHASEICEPATVLAGGYLDWYRQSGGISHPITSALDIVFGARCMIELLGGDGATGQMPSSADPAIQRHLRRCLSGAADPNAWSVLRDFDRLITALWGQRKFRPLDLPGKEHAEDLCPI